MTVGETPWLEGLEPLLDEEAIYERAFRGARPLSFTAEQPVEQKVRLLESALKEIYVPTPGGCQLILMLVGRLYAALIERYSDIDNYKSKVYEPPKNDEDENYICLTGLAGVGKTSLLAAFERVIPAPRLVHLSDSLPDVQINLIRRLKIKSKASDSQVYLALANKLFAQGKKKLGQNEARDHIVPWLFNTGVVMVAVDEMQFFTQSKTANTKVTKLLMSLGGMAPVLVMAMNYSLVRRLLNRPQEERDRLLADCHILEPDRPEADSWQRLIAECVNVLPDTFNLDPPSCSIELHRLTAGLPRMLRQLLLCAYRYTAKAYEGSVNMSAIREAYRSQAFSTQRANVEALVSLSVSKSKHNNRSDLICPFDGNNFSERPGVAAAETQGDVSSTMDPYERVVTPAVQYQLESTLPPEVRRTLKTIRNISKPAPADTKKSGSVHPIRKKKQTETDGLYQGLDAFREEISGEHKNE